MIKTKNIYCLLAPSGAGKTTVAHELCKRYGLSEVVSYTDRPRRPNEGNTHIFTDTKTMNQLKSSLVAWTFFSGHNYGVTPDQIDENNIYVIDPLGIEYMKSHYKGKKQCRVIFLACDSDTCHARMLARGDKPLDIARRLANDKIAFQDAESIADFIVNDYNLEDCINQIWDYIRKTEGENT